MELYLITLGAICGIIIAYISLLLIDYYIMIVKRKNYQRYLSLNSEIYNHNDWI